jgi:hypothetical protein
MSETRKMVTGLWACSGPLTEQMLVDAEAISDGKLYVIDERAPRPEPGQLHCPVFLKASTSSADFKQSLSFVSAQDAVEKTEEDLRFS